ncbi:MAG: hypothetical protein D6737_14070 [Chloroflexi bacterium]|nr:MAG: hypothetical protein CUN54_03915 [Phototrophicales bacterium]RMF78654.1 MAG: hypothetical protein D6737_14070 [Chloroflexota bacterium]
MTTNTTLASRRRRRRSNFPFLPVISIIFILIAGGIFLSNLIRFSQQQSSLPADLTVGGVPVGGLTPREAVARWEQAFAEPITLYYGNAPILLDPASVGFRISSDSMLATARSAGNSENSFWVRFFNQLTNRESRQAFDIPLNAEYQSSLVEQFLIDISRRYDRPSGTATFDVQTLTIRQGDSGFMLDIENAMRKIDAALRDPINRTVILPIQDSEGRNTNIKTLEELIIAYLDSEGFIFDGQTTVASVYIQDLSTGEEVNILGDVAFSAASTMKLPILIDYYRHLPFAPTPEEAWLMANSLLCSNNSSSNLLMQIIGNQDIFAGIASVTNTAQFLGAKNTFITAPFDLGIEGQQLGSIPAPQTSPNPNFNTAPDPFNQTTTEDLGTLFSLIYDCANFGSGLMAALPDGEFTQIECQQMLELTSANDLLRLLQAGIPPGTRISHKNGWIADTHGDAGIVYPPNGRDYVIAVFLWEDATFLDFNRIWPLIEGISRAAWNYFSPEAPLLTPRTDIPETAQDCEGNYLPPGPEFVDLNNINGWRQS